MIREKKSDTDEYLAWFLFKNWVKTVHPRTQKQDSAVGEKRKGLGD